VIGTPLDEAFPKQNAQLQQRIAKEHLVVTEFSPGVRVARGNFPRRNRTMALIADASVIIEAGEGRAVGAGSRERSDTGRQRCTTLQEDVGVPVLLVHDTVDANRFCLHDERDK
jgi:DNA processing protein